MKQLNDGKRIIIAISTYYNRNYNQLFKALPEVDSYYNQLVSVTITISGNDPPPAISISGNGDYNCYFCLSQK